MEEVGIKPSWETMNSRKRQLQERLERDQAARMSRVIHKAPIYLFIYIYMYMLSIAYQPIYPYPYLYTAHTHTQTQTHTHTHNIYPYMYTLCTLCTLCSIHTRMYHNLPDAPCNNIYHA